MMPIWIKNYLESSRRDEFNGAKINEGHFFHDSNFKQLLLEAFLNRDFPFLFHYLNSINHTLTFINMVRASGRRMCWLVLRWRYGLAAFSWRLRWRCLGWTGRWGGGRLSARSKTSATGSHKNICRRSWESCECSKKRTRSRRWRILHENNSTSNLENTGWT